MRSEVWRNIEEIFRVIDEFELDFRINKVGIKSIEKFIVTIKASVLILRIHFEDYVTLGSYCAVVPGMLL